MQKLSKPALTATLIGLLAAATLADYLLQPKVPTTQSSTTHITHLWATWCPPCVTELPALIAAHQRTPHIPITLIAVDASATTVTTFLRKQGISSTQAGLTWVTSPTALQQLMPQAKLPTTLIYTQNNPSPTVINGMANWATLLPALP